LKWDFVFPVVDVALVSTGIAIGRSAEGVLYYVYLIPIAEAASTLNVRWAQIVGMLAVLGAAVATYGQQPENVLGATFRLAFMVVMASLLAWLAKFAAELRAELRVAADRHRIAQDMHDGVQGQLIAIASRLELAKSVAVQDVSRAKVLVEEARQMTRSAADELRFLVHRFRARELEEGFLPALQEHLHNLRERHGLAVLLEKSGEGYVLTPEVEHALFRIVQESLNNVVKHSGARTATVQIDYETDRVVCQITDDGQGFDLGTAPVGQGLVGIESRAKALGGEARIESALGQGTVVQAIIPRRVRRPRGD
jgi:signal transduction histidine kinase